MALVWPVSLGYFSARYIAILWQNPHHRAMKHSLPIFTMAFLLFVADVRAGEGEQLPLPLGEGGKRSLPGEGVRRSYYASDSPLLNPEPRIQSAASGNGLVHRAAENVQAERAICADLRYKIDAFGHDLVGLGSYRQLGQGSEKQLRLELKIQVADQAVTRQEICGPQYYWVRRESPFAPSTLGRVNLRQVRSSLARAPEPLASDPLEVWIMLGGLSKLLESLQRNFEFEAPREDELQFTSAEGSGVERLPVLILSGKWKPDRLAALLESQKPPQQLPTQIPDRVEIVLGRPDQVLPLFPYRITYLKDDGKGRGEGPSRTMLSIELFNVYRNQQIDPREFDYQPGDQEVADLTGAYLQRLGLGTKTR
jgi:hypothetical protein